MQSVRRRRLLYQPCCLAFLLFVSFWNAGVWWSFESAESALFPPLNTPAPLRRPLLSAGYQRIGSLSVPQKKPYNVLARTTGSNHDQPHLVCTNTLKAWKPVRSPSLVGRKRRFDARTVRSIIESLPYASLTQSDSDFERVDVYHHQYTTGTFREQEYRFLSVSVYNFQRRISASGTSVSVSLDVVGSVVLAAPCGIIMGPNRYLRGLKLDSFHPMNRYIATRQKNSCLARLPDASSYRLCSQRGDSFWRASTYPTHTHAGQEVRWSSIPRYRTLRKPERKSGTMLQDVSKRSSSLSPRAR